MKLSLLFACAVLVALVLLLELGLRQLFGFGNPLIYQGDPEIGYLLAPNQKTRRFGNRIEINAYSMRSAAVTPKRSPDTLRVLLIGDSIVNGGWWTDQSNIISEMLKQDLQTAVRDRAQGATANFSPPSFSAIAAIEVLNASANSWGPRNELAYLKRFGCFESQAVVLVINTDDLFATAPTALPVGNDRNYPDRQPPLAIAEAISRYLLPVSPISEAMQAVQAEPGDRVGFNLEAIRQIHTLVQQSHAHLLLIMTPLRRELGKPGSRDYEVNARQRLLELSQTEQIPYIDFLPIFNAASQPQQLYHDHIHLSSAGSQLVSARVQQWLTSLN